MTLQSVFREHSINDKLLIAWPTDRMRVTISAREPPLSGAASQLPPSDPVVTEIDKITPRDVDLVDVHAMEHDPTSATIEADDVEEDGDIVSFLEEYVEGVTVDSFCDPAWVAVQDETNSDDDSYLPTTRRISDLISTNHKKN